MSGPKTVLCGTAIFIISQWENMPLSFTFCFRLARNENSNSFASWEKPYISILLRIMLCEMELNAFERSRKIATVSLLWSKSEETVSTSSKTASVADFLFWNPNCSLLIILCLSMKSIIWVRRRRSKIFEKLRVTEIGR